MLIRFHAAKCLGLQNNIHFFFIFEFLKNTRNIKKKKKRIFIIVRSSAYSLATKIYIDINIWSYDFLAYKSMTW